MSYAILSANDYSEIRRPSFGKTPPRSAYLYAPKSSRASPKFFSSRPVLSGRSSWKMRDAKSDNETRAAILGKRFARFLFIIERSGKKCQIVETRCIFFRCRPKGINTL